MDGTASRTAAGEALSALRASVDLLLDADLGALSGVQVAGVLGEVEVQRRRLEAVDVRLVAEVAARGVAGEFGRSSVTDLLVTELRVAPRDARARRSAAQDLGPRSTVTGEALEPLQPLVAAGLRDGVLSAAHAAVISQCLARVERIAGIAVHEVVPVVEGLLVTAAQHEHPTALARTAQLVLVRLDPDGPEPRDRERSRDFSLYKNPDGSCTAKGRLTAEATAAWETILDSLAAPLPTADGGEPDPRTAGQRRHDGLLDAALRLLRSASLPASGGVPVTILLRTTAAELAAGVGVVQTGHGDLWPATLTQQLLDDADIHTVVENYPDNDAHRRRPTSRYGVLAMGRTKRLATRTQRLALAARDGGCSFPGCTRPAAWTEVHHITPWLEGGLTDVDNLCLLCRFHHREFEKRGWHVQMTDGRPEWLPPPWLDPDQQPRRNTAHHLPDLDFTTPTATNLDSRR